MNDRDRIRVALIGYGFAGRTFHAPLIAAVPALELVAVASRDAARVHADLPGVELIADPMRAAREARAELVVIATPNDSHVALADAALRAGRHVVVDKPLAPTLREARALAALARERDRVLGVFHNRRWDSDFLAVREAVDAGRIGEPVQLEARWERFRPGVRDRWRERTGPAGGLWWDLGPHLVDQALQLFGHADTVQAAFASQRDGAATDDWAHVVLEFGARRAVLHASLVAAAPGARLTVHGTRGSLVKRSADVQEAQLVAGLRPGDPDWGVDPDPLHWHRDDGRIETLPTPRGDQSRFYAHLAAALRDGGKPPVTTAQALEVMAVLEAAVASAAQGRRLAPDTVDTAD